MWTHVHSMASYQHGRHSTATDLSARAQECKKRGVTTGWKDIDPYVLKLRWNALTKDNPQLMLSSSVWDQLEVLQATAVIIRWYSQLNKVQLNFMDWSSLSTVKAAFVPRTGKKNHSQKSARVSQPQPHDFTRELKFPHTKTTTHFLALSSFKRIRCLPEINVKTYILAITAPKSAENWCHWGTA